jgi:hypothetical protein
VLAGAEPGVMPDRDRAAGIVGGQVGGEPPTLRRRALAALDRGAVRVEDDDVPAAEIV